MKIFYHMDFDGKLAGAIVNYFELKFYGTKNIELIGVDFDRPFPYDLIGHNEKIYIVDYRPDDWETLLKCTSNVIWIDHHKTSIDDFNSYELMNTNSVNVNAYTDINYSGCMLAWKFFTNDAAPLVVELIQDMDIWKWNYGKFTSWLVDGLSIYNTDPRESDSVWYDLLCESDENLISLYMKIMNDGLLIGKFINQRSETVSRKSFSVKWNGYNVLCVNRTGGYGSLTFNSLDRSKYDILCSFYFNGENWIVSLYTEKDGIDVGEIAKRNGGGGHKQSAGFQSSYEDFPFRRKGNHRHEHKILKET